MSRKTPLINKNQLHDGDKIPFTVDGINILLIKNHENIHIIENRCGHFGAPLNDGVLDEQSISCLQHLAKFSLLTGEVLNNSVSQCDQIQIYHWKEEDNQIIFTGDKKLPRK